MKTSTVIITLLLVSATTIAVVRHQTLGELYTKRASLGERLNEENTSHRDLKSRETGRIRPFIDFLDQARGTLKDDRDLALLLGTLPDLSHNELLYLIETLAGEEQPNQNPRDRIIVTAFQLLSPKNPESALALILELRENDSLDPRFLDHATRYAIQHLARHDPLAAARWFNDHTDGPDPARIRQGILTSAAKLDLSLALDLVKELKFDPGNRNETYSAYRAIGLGMSLESVDLEINAIRSLDPGHRTTILRSFASGEFAKDFDASVNWFERSSLTPGEKGKILFGISHSSIKEDPGKWLDFISNQPTEEGTERNLVMSTGQTIYDWAVTDFVAAGEWLKGQKDSPIKTQGVSRYIEVIYGREPKVAAEWLAVLPTDHADHKRLTSFIHRSLSHQDPAAAAAFAEEYQIKK